MLDISGHSLLKDSLKFLVLAALGITLLLSLNDVTRAHSKVQVALKGQSQIYCTTSARHNVVAESLTSQEPISKYNHRRSWEHVINSGGKFFGYFTW